MSQPVVEQPSSMGGEGSGPSSDFGVWTGYRIADDRTGWHPLVAQFYEYWLSVSPPGRLPGRAHIVPEDIPFLWSRLFLLDVHRAPLRLRYRFCGTEIVRVFGREVTGCWLDEAHPDLMANPEAQQQFRFMAETGCPTWRRGSPLWSRDPEHRSIETCIVPLAADGRVVDKMIGVLVVLASTGKPA